MLALHYHPFAAFAQKVVSALYEAARGQLRKAYDMAEAALDGRTKRLCARPSFARAIEEARPYRGNFPRER